MAKVALQFNSFFLYYFPCEPTVILPCIAILLELKCAVICKISLSRHAFKYGDVPQGFVSKLINNKVPHATAGKHYRR